MNRSALAALALLALCACQGERKEQGAGTASGQVLEGSASDAMLPLDTVRSQAPLAPHSEAAGKARSAAGKDGSAEAGPAASEAAPVPADEPAPEAAEE